ncbi:MAG: glycosyltransferase family 4 protein [archaeon]|nr:glycosyltransferase family 4 protein [archaeon]
MDPVNYGDTSKSSELYIAEEMAKEGNEVFLFTDQKQYEKLYENYQNIKVIILKIQDKKFLEEYSEKLDEYKSDIVFATSISAYDIVSLFSKRWNAKSSIFILDIPTWQLYFQNRNDHIRNQLEKIKDFDIIFTNTSITKKIIMQLNKNIQEEKLEAIYYPVPLEESDKVKAKEKKHQVVFVGNLSFHKGIEILFYAFTMFSDPPELIIIGTSYGDEMVIKLPNDTLISTRLMNLKNELNIKVKFLGNASNDEKFNIIKESKLAVFPQFSKSIPSIAQLECSYSGTPTIVSDTLINRENCGESVNYITDFFNTRTWTEKIFESINNKEYEKENKKQREWIIENRSPKVITKKILDRFKQLFDHS